MSGLISQESVAEFRRRVPSVASAGLFEKLQEVKGEGGGPGPHDEGLCPDYKAQAARHREQAAAIREQIEPLLLEIEKIEGVRPPTLASARSVQLELAADRLDLAVEELEFKMRHPQ